jgi:predicted transcriptional regulator
MITIKFTESEVEQLKQERFNHPSPKGQLKMEALYLKSKGLSHNQICDVCAVTRATFASYLKSYITGGIEELKQLNYRGRENEMLKCSVSKYVKKSCLYSRYYAKFSDFKQALSIA